jgi:L-alanine-DL-glutamate epimerase-like enolase superfamily enzyme
VYCFSPYWVGSLLEFQRLAHMAGREGFQVCKHTHGELGIAAAACHHVLLTLPNVVEGNQQTARMMQDDVIVEPLPITSGPYWGTPDGPGLGVEVDEAKVRKYHAHFQQRGQYRPYDETAVFTKEKS